MRFSNVNVRLWTIALCLLMLIAALSWGEEVKAQDGSTSASADRPAVIIGFDGEFGHTSSTSAESIKRGILAAIHEINASGGVLKGRPLKLETRDNRSVPARGVRNIRELASIPDLVAVFGGKFSPVVLETVPVAQELALPILDPWAAADEIVDNGFAPNFVFRLSLKDSWAIPVMLKSLKSRSLTRFAALLPNTSWGRSNQKVLEQYLAGEPGMKMTGQRWYNWGEKTLIERFQDLKRDGAQALIFVGNEAEGAILVREVGALPARERIPIVSHWGVTGGNFPKLCGDSLSMVDFTVVQTFSFFDTKTARSPRVLDLIRKLFQISDAAQVDSPVGLAHAYDLTHILAQAINLAGTTDRKAIRSALERTRVFKGLVRTYERPFTPDRHEALDLSDVFLAKYGPDGILRKVGTKGHTP